MFNIFVFFCVCRFVWHSICYRPIFCQNLIQWMNHRSPIHFHKVSTHIDQSRLILDPYIWKILHFVLLLTYYMYFYVLKACMMCPGGLRWFFSQANITFWNSKHLLGDQAASGGFFSAEFVLFEIISLSYVIRCPPAFFFHPKLTLV